MDDPLPQAGSPKPGETAAAPDTTPGLDDSLFDDLGREAGDAADIPRVAPNVFGDKSPLGVAIQRNHSAERDNELSTFKTRMVLGSILLAVVLGLFTVDFFIESQICFIVLLTAATVTGIIEFYKMARHAGTEPWWFSGAVFGGLIIIGQYALTGTHNPTLQREGAELFLIFFLIGMMVLTVLFPERKRDAASIAVTTFGVLYIAYFMSYYVKIRNLEGGQAMIWLIFLGSKCTDMGAYLIGRKFGSIKLIPKVSPNKTVEGAAGGIACGVAAVLIVYYAGGLFKLTSFPLTTALFLGTVVSVSAMGGDLFESLVKRRYEVKDSAGYVPAFGGVLDMIDSILLNGPLMYFIVTGAGILKGVQG